MLSFAFRYLCFHSRFKSCVSGLFLILLPVSMAAASDLASRAPTEVLLSTSQVKNIVVEMRYYDEVLTSSVLSYVFSSDEKWMKRYYEYEPKLGQQIDLLLSNQVISDKDVVSRLNKVNEHLVKLERRVIFLVKQQQRKKAMALINSDEYHRYKAEYMGVLLDFASQIEQQISKNEANHGIKLSDEEIKWIENNTVRMGIENIPPTLFKNSDGSLDGVAGIIVEQIMQKTGLKIEYVEAEWDELLHGFYTGEVDLLPHAYKNDERKQYGTFSTPYFLARELFFVASNSQQFKHGADLSSATIALAKGYTTKDKIKHLYPEIKIRESRDLDEAIQLVLSGQADAVLDAESLIEDWLVRNNSVALRPINEDVVAPSMLHLLSHKQHPHLASIIQKGLDSLELRDLLLSNRDRQQAEVIPQTTTLSDSTKLNQSLWWMLGALLLLFLSLAFTVSRIFSASDKELAEKFGSNRFKRSIIIGLLVLCLLLVISAYLVTEYVQKQNRSSLEYNLSALVNTTQQRMSLWVDYQINELDRVGSNDELIGLVEALLKVPRNHQALVQSTTQASIRSFFLNNEKDTESFGYFIISPDRISLASSRDANIGGINLIEQQRPDLIDSLLNGNRVFIPPIRSDVYLNAQDEQEGALKPPTMFFAVPVKNKQGKVIAILTKRVNFDGAFSHILTSGFIGRSGESYALDRSGLLLSNVRFEKELKEAGLLRYNQRSSLNLRIADPGHNLLDKPQAFDRDWPLTKMAQSIFERESSIDLNGYADYRGITVVGKWIWDEKLGIGIAAEMEVEEAFGTMRILNYTVWSMLFLSLVLTVGSSLFTLRLGTRAMRTLVQSQAELERQVQARTQELQAHSERTRMIIENASDGIIVVNRNGIIQDFSPAAERIFDYRPEDLLGRTVASLMDTPFHEHYLEQKLQGFITHVLFEFTGYKQDGSEIDIEVAVGEVKLKDEVLFTGIVRDASKRKESERELMLAKQKAEDATQAKSDFLANMSHEIRTPMNAIIGMSYLAMQTELNRKQAGYLGKIQSSAEALLGIINDILDFSKIEAGKLDLENIDFNLNTVIDDLVQVIAQRSQQKGVELLTDIDSTLPLGLMGDPLRLGQILLNLTNNALKFTDDGEIIVKVDVLNICDDRIELKFSVQDTGIGMTEEQQGRLFKSFSQADASTTRKYGGTGLGLTISKTLTELMGGEIGVVSEYGKGSTFFFTANLAVSNSLNQEPSLSSEDIGELRVLIVDDSVAAREILYTMVSSLGFIAESVSSGAEAIDKLMSAEQRGKRFDLVLADWKMPQMNGIELREGIAAADLLQSQPYFVMVTAYDRDEMLKHAQHVQLDGSLTKPVSASTLLDTVLKVMGKRKLSPYSASSNKLDMSSTQDIVGAKVLLVEDNEINQEIATELLTMAGLDVSSAWNGQEAVTMVSQQPYDVVLMDVQMPVMDGYEATRAIRQSGLHDDLPIIAMTANAMAGDKERCIDAGMNDHLAKPIDPHLVYRTLAQWVKPTGKTLSEPPIIVSAEIEETVKIDNFDTQAAIARMGGSVKAYKKTLARVVEIEADAVHRLDQALQAKDINSAVIAVHSLKGLAATIGATMVVAPSEHVELILLKQQQQGIIEYNAELKKLIAELAVVVNNMVSSIEQALAQDTSPPVHAQAFDFSLFSELSERLTTQMDNYDSAAIDSFEEISRLVGTAIEPKLQKTILTALSAFDFDAAEEPVKQYLAALMLPAAANEPALDLDLSSRLQDIEQQIEMYDFSVVETVEALLDSPLPPELVTPITLLRTTLSECEFGKGAAQLLELKALVIKDMDS